MEDALLSCIMASNLTNIRISMVHRYLFHETYARMQAQKPAKNIIVLCSALKVQRISTSSAFRKFPVELIRMVKNFQY